MIDFRKLRPALAVALALGFGAAHAAAAQGQAGQPWMDRSRPSGERAELALAAMTQAEKLSLVFGFASGDQLGQIADSVINAEARRKALASVVPGSAGWIPGVPRLGIPDQFQTDASLGVRNPRMDGHTALPSSLATAASFDPKLTFAGGAMIGREARLSGFNIMLAGGVNLVREPRNGRNFEYAGEDPLLAASVSAGLVNGIQSNAIVSTMKHFAINSQETGRTVLSAQIAEGAARDSDYLAFELVQDWARPGSVMCSYNRINDVYACENDRLLNQALKQDWGFKGYVMSDWGAVHSTVQAANAGLDQQSGFPFDKQAYFGTLLERAVEDGSVPQARLDDMVRRILWALFDKGAVDNPVAKGTIDWDAHARVTLKAAQDSMVLLKNTENLLPLRGARSIALIGGHADRGVLAGGGSSLVMPRGGNAVPGLKPEHWPGPVVYYPSSPLKALQSALPRARVAYDPGTDPVAAAALAAKSDVAIVFVTQWTGEAFDVSLALEGQQDALVEAVARANPRTLVVVESGGAILMPWLPRVGAVLQAWYPGTQGGQAIADILTGAVNPSGRLPITFPASMEQLVRPRLDGIGLKDSEGFTVRYTEGAAVGYKWYDQKGLTPLFPFGYGLSYSRFTSGKLRIEDKPAGLTATVQARNTGARKGATVVQLYASPKAGGWEAPKRLVAFQKVWLEPGESRDVTLTIDPRLLSVWDPVTGRRRVTEGDYLFSLGDSAQSLTETVSHPLADRKL